MAILLDTHIVLGVVHQSRDLLPTSVLRCLAEPHARLVVSVGSLWEIAIKNRLGKLPLDLDLSIMDRAVDAFGLELIPVTARHVLTKLEVEPPTRDPFDRLFLAQAQAEDMRLLTLDRALADHPLAWRAGLT